MMAAPSLALLRIMAEKPEHQWTLMELQAAAGLTSDELTAVLQWLRLQRLIRRPPTRCYILTPAGARLAAEPVVTQPQAVTNDLYTLVWRALRLQKKASASELLELIGKPATRGAKQSVRDYLNALVKVGVVGISRFRSESSERLYQLRQDLGPRAPAFEQDGRRLIDTNNGRPLEVSDAAA